MEEDEDTAVTEEDEAAIQADAVLVEADAAAAAEEMAEPAEDRSSKPSRPRSRSSSRPMAEHATYAATATICREIVRSTMIVETMFSGWTMTINRTRHPGRRKSGRNVPTL